MNTEFQRELQNRISDLKKEGLYNKIKTLESPQGAWLEINGEEVLNFSSNNYLGLANHKEIVKAAQDALNKFGIGPGAVRSIAGTMTLHNELEKKLAEFKKTEAVLTFQSGFNANLAVIPALVGREDTIISDELNHASIIDGTRLSGAEVKVYNHVDMKSLEEVLQSDCKGRKLIVTDGVFSMDGDIAPLADIVELGKKYNALVMVDDAHGEGVLGSHGRGIVDHFNLHGEVDIEVGTFSKAIGTVGGCVAGSKVLKEYLKQQGRPFLFSSAVTPPDIAATIKAVEILQRDDKLVSKLWENGDKFKEKLKEAGFDVGHSETPITPVMIGDAKTAQELSDRLFEEKIFAQSIGYPTVPKGKARIRVMISAVHSSDDLEYAVEKFKKVGKEMDLI
ncbi:glycine C-acetyltransferase [Halanaerobium sp. MA284_MarDTE_T2]|nr:glycine C-acetyltransferase [Halanaerobium sp. MA284_MarDTE_T2]RCW46624.1 glycine C-acetyltransferase [Halanaerobium sp. MA284_MarDTE_T2]